MGRLSAAGLLPVFLAAFSAGKPAGLLRAVWPFLLTAALVALNEMGDKSQLLALAFAARMRFSKVLAGIGLACAVMASLAVAAGALLARVPGWQGGVRLASAVLFLLFAAFTLAPEPEGERAPARRTGGDVAAVFTSFLVAEMGDKTQIATISLAAQFPDSPLRVLGGAVFGFLLADGLGVFAGAVLHRHLPGRALRVLSAALFLAFGLSGVWDWMRLAGRPPAACVLAALLAAALTAALCALVGPRRPSGAAKTGNAKNPPGPKRGA